MDLSVSAVVLIVLLALQEALMIAIQDHAILMALLGMERHLNAMRIAEMEKTTGS